MYSFVNDYSEGAHEKILQVLSETNRIQTSGYGTDEYCSLAQEYIEKELDGAKCAVHFLVGGTQANLTVISAALRPHQGVISAVTGHIFAHESGAIEAVGHRVMTLPADQGKITARQIESRIKAHYADENAEHTVQPGMVYLSNPTEYGTLYSKKELQEIYRICKRHDLLLYVDGARLGCALTAEDGDLTMADMAKYTDAFTIGGTKMGALFGEVIVIRNEALGKDFRYIEKQKGGMLAKGRLLGIQFGELFRDGLYYELARHANAMAKVLSEGIVAQGYTLKVPTQTNQVFAIFPKKQIELLREQFAFSFWEPFDARHDIVRLCTSWATPREKVADFLALLRSLTVSGKGNVLTKLPPYGQKK